MPLRKYIMYIAVSLLVFTSAFAHDEVNRRDQDTRSPDSPNAIKFISGIEQTRPASAEPSDNSAKVIYEARGYISEKSVDTLKNFLLSLLNKEGAAVPLGGRVGSETRRFIAGEKNRPEIPILFNFLDDNFHFCVTKIEALEFQEYAVKDYLSVDLESCVDKTPFHLSLSSNNLSIEGGDEAIAGAIKFKMESKLLLSKSGEFLVSVRKTAHSNLYRESSDDVMPPIEVPPSNEAKHKTPSSPLDQKSERLISLPPQTTSSAEMNGSIENIPHAETQFQMLADASIKEAGSNALSGVGYVRVLGLLEPGVSLDSAQRAVSKLNGVLSLSLCQYNSNGVYASCAASLAATVPIPSSMCGGTAACTKSLPDHLTELSNSASVDTLRRSHSADLVLLMRNTGDLVGGGIERRGISYHGSAFAVAKSVPGEDQYTAAHELGHLLGATHSRNPAETYPVSPSYAAATSSTFYHTTECVIPHQHGYRTFMSYPHVCHDNVIANGWPSTCGNPRVVGCELISIFSKPSFSFTSRGQSVTVSNAGDNFRSVVEQFSFISQLHEKRVELTVSVTPATTTSGQPFTLKWKASNAHRCYDPRTSVETSLEGTTSLIADVTKSFMFRCDQKNPVSGYLSDRIDRSASITVSDSTPPPPPPCGGSGGVWSPPCHPTM